MSTIDKISEIKDIFENIAEAIEEKGVDVGECDSPKTYPTKILRITGDGSTIPLLFDADYEEGAEVAVDYEVNDEGIGIFHFTLARGPKGEDGKNGTDGAHGADGKDGVDGTDIQFIFARTNNGTPDKPESDPDSDALPTGGNITWYSVPQGVDDDHIYEYVCKRVKDPTTKKWGEYSTPAIWAQGGKVGRDGNGIEYIFCLTDSENNVPTVPESDPNKSEDEIKWPLVSGSFKGYDDPLTVLATSPCCWVSVRKQSINEVDGVDVQTWGKYSPASLGSKYSKDGIDGGGRTVFAYCASNTKPSKPRDGGGDPKTNTATAPHAPSGETVTWYLNPVSIEEGQHLYQSNASFDSTGAIQGEGSDPVRITGEDGVNGKDGESVQFIYRLIPNKSNFDLLSDWHSDDAHALDSDPTGNDKAPEKTDRSTSSKPGGNFVENGSELFWTICDTEGTDEPKGIDGVNYLIECACTRTKNSVTDETTGDKKEEWGPWSKPFLGAVGGEDGIDGTGVEYIYLVTPKTYVSYEDGKEIIREITGEDLKLPTKAEYQAYDKVHKTDYVSLFEQPEFIPGKTDNNIFDTNNFADNAGGTDEPRDVSQDQPVEGVSIRKRQVEEGEHTGKGGDFSVPVIGNKWVTDGTSFKTAFAFTRTDEDLTKVTVEGGKLYIPSGGSYKDPVPVNARVWLGDKSIDLTGHDTIPEGAGKVGMTSRLFSANEFVEVADSDWSIPTPMTDSSIMQIEFAQVYKDEKGEHEDVIPNPVSFQKYYEEATGERDEKLNNAESAGRDVEKTKGGYWNDGEKISDPMWMAVCYQKNGKGTDGTVTRVKGERGTAGKNGTSVTILGSANEETCQFDKSKQQTLPNNQLAKFILENCNNKLTLYEGSEDERAYIEKEVHNNGDGYLVDQDLGVGDGDSFENVGQIKGDPGENAHLYIAFSNNAEVLDRDSSISIDLTAKTGKYIGYLTSSYEIDKEALKNSLTYTYGTKGTGDDGWGYEQIYLLTKEVHTDNLIIDYDNGPLVPKRGESVSLDDGNTAGYLPFVDEQYEEYSKGSDDVQGMKWFDVPQSPTAEYPYCGVAHRNTSDWEWKGQWVYDKENPDASYYRAALYSRYVPDLGHLELDNDNLVVPLDGGNVDADFTATINLSFYYAGQELTENVDYFFRGKEEENWSIASKTLNIDSSTSSDLDKYLFFKATYNGVDYYKNCTIRKVDNAYKLKVDSKIIHKGATYNPKEITCTVQKWSVDTWNDAETHIYYKVDNEEEKTYNEVFNCSEEQPQKNVRFYIKNNDDILDFEDVAVVTDGTSAYHLQLSEDHVTVPLIASGYIDEDYKGFDIVATLYAGDIALDEDENIKYSYKLGESGGEVESKSELITIERDSLAEKPNKLTIFATRSSTKGHKDVKIDYNSIAYEMTVSKNIIRRDASTNNIVDTDDTIEVTVMKWSGTEWLAANDVTVYANAGYVEDTPIDINPMLTINGVARFGGLTTFEGLAGIKFYIEDDNNSEIAHENVGVVVNGEDGAWQEFIYQVFASKPDSIDDPTPRKDGGDIDYETEFNGKKYSDPEYVPVDGKDDPQDLTTAGQYQYVSVRKKVNNQWQAFSTPVIWSYKPFDGEDGEDAISVSFGSSPTIFLNENNLLASGNLNVSIGAMQGSKVLNINSVTFKSATYNDSLLNNLSLNYSDGILSISGLDNSINDTGIITIFMEVNISGISSLIQTSLTIVVQKSGGQNAKQVSLSEDSVTVFKGVETTVTTTATFYDGGSQKEAAWFIDGVQTNTATSYTYKTEGSFSETTSIPITAKYNDVEYSKVFRINVVDTEDRYGIVLSPDVINISNNDTHNIKISVGKQSRNNEPQQLEELPNGFKLKLGTGELNGLETTISRGTSKNKEVTISLVQTSDGEEFTGDSETITLNRDPIVYSLTVSPETILADNEGKCNTNIEVTFKAFEGGLDITDDYNPIIKYQKNGVEGNYSENGVLVTEVSSNGDTYTFSAYLNGIVVASRSVTASIGQGDPGPKGEQGKAPIIYPEGEWNSGTEYNGTGNLAPYVYVVEESGELSYFVAYGNVQIGTNPLDPDNQNDNPDWNNIPEQVGKWVKMHKYNAIYADIGKFNTALVGSWIFYKDGMFSQNGMDAHDKYEISYNNIPQPDLLEQYIEGGDGIPNILFNAKTGEGSFGAGKVKLGTNSTVTSVGGWEVTDDGLIAKNNNTEIAKLGNDGSGYLGNYTDDGKAYKGIQGDDTSLKLGNNLKITNDGFIASDDLNDSQSYFKLGKVTFSEDSTSEYIEFKSKNNSGFRSDSCGGFGLAVYGPNAFVDNMCYNSALVVIATDNYEALKVAGNVSIISTSVSNPVKLTVQGDIECRNLTQDSDERLKNFSTDISVDLDELAKLRKQYFTGKDSESNEQQIGVSAQEIQKLYPELVKERENGYLGVSYDKLVVVALKAIDILHQNNLELKAEIKELRNQLINQ